MRGAVLLLLLALSGCSLVVVTGPRAQAPRYAPGCRTSAVTPVLDATAALAAGVGAGLAGIAYEECRGDRCGLRAGAAVAALLAGLVLGVSAAYGFSTERLCREAEAAHAIHMNLPARRRLEPAP